MPHYVRQGQVPSKRHVQFRGPEGELRYEEHVSRKGFSDIYSNLYHLRMPTRVQQVGDFAPLSLLPAPASHRARHVRTGRLELRGDAISSRCPLFFNDELVLHKAHITQDSVHLHRSGHFDEMLYVQSGAGTLQTNYGDLSLSPGDYVVIPRGVIWRLSLNEPMKMLVVESKGPIETPERYRNRHGQLLEHAPFCERDIRLPVLQPPRDDSSEHLVRVRFADGYQDVLMAHHPFDVVGWDGYFYPWALNIRDFEPIVGSIHQPPPVHQTFQAPGFVVCSFVSRPFDFHPEAVPAPYPHSNVDSDEIIFYSWGDFMSRKGIETESITLHPMGIVHGPQPGKYEASIGQKKTEELAVMIDTFAPLRVAAGTLPIDDSDYARSWIG